MCGILAIIRPNPPRQAAPPVDDRALHAALDHLRRRGPDGQGVWTSPCRRILLGHARLAIQDLSDAGRQPMADRITGDPAAPRAVITFNGEIYNAPALRDELQRAGVTFHSRTDTEVILRGYLAWGLAGVLDRLRGMFAFVLVDLAEPDRPLIHAAVDHAGMKPLMHARLPEGGLAIASDCDALRALLSAEPGWSSRLDGHALAHVLSVGYCPAPLTVWRNVRSLPAGACFTWKPHAEPEPAVTRWWSPPEHLDSSAADPRDHQQAFEALLRTVADDHLLADVPVGLFLSAGLDSTSLAVALAQAGRADDLSAYTLSARSTPAADDESPLAAATARAMMLRHHHVIFDPADLRTSLTRAAAAFDQPQGFTALLTATEIARATRALPRAPRVVLGGDGGDEALAGYRWHHAGKHPLALDDEAALTGDHAADRWSDHAALAAKVREPWCDAPTRARAAIALAGLSFTHRYLCRVFAGFHPAESTALLAALEPQFTAEHFAAWLAPHDRAALPPPRRAQRLDLLGFCAGSILPKLDRACMAVGLELRAPFLDRRVLEWALPRRVDPAERAADTAKPPLRRLLARAAQSGLVSPDLLTRPKQGFSLRLGEARPFEALAADLLPASRLIADGVLRRDWAAFLPTLPEAREQRLFTLCLLAAWYQTRAA